MLVKLFDIQNGQVIPTEHCYTLNGLRMIMNRYKEDNQYLKVYMYLFYMTCPNPDMNPFFNVPEHDKQDLIFQQIGPVDFSPEDEYIIMGMELCEKLYATPTLRAYKGIKSMLDRLADYMENTTIEHGRDGNINSLVNAAAKFEQIRLSFKGAYKDLLEEQKSTVRGGQQIAYDQ